MLAQEMLVVQSRATALSPRKLGRMTRHVRDVFKLHRVISGGSCSRTPDKRVHLQQGKQPGFESGRPALVPRNLDKSIFTVRAK